MPRVRDTAVARYGAARLVERYRAMVAEIGGVRLSDDIEHVHRMRVASRRLRAALGLFGEHVASRRTAKRWTRDVREITRALGDARDADVQLEFIDARRAGSAGEGNEVLAGLDRLALRLRQRRHELQPAVEKALDALEESPVVAELPKLLGPLASSGPGLPPEEAEAALETARAIVPRRIRKLTAFDAAVDDPARVDDHHAMRIAAKKLRYTLEAFVPVAPGRFDPWVQTIKRLQKRLGELHDCDVWIEFLPRFLEEERERTVAFHGGEAGFALVVGGVEHLHASRRADRTKLHDRLVQEWRASGGAEAWADLERTLTDPC